MVPRGVWARKTPRKGPATPWVRMVAGIRIRRVACQGNEEGRLAFQSSATVLGLVRFVKVTPWVLANSIPLLLPVIIKLVLVLVLVLVRIIRFVHQTGEKWVRSIGSAPAQLHPGPVTQGWKEKPCPLRAETLVAGRRRRGAGGAMSKLVVLVLIS